MHLGYIRHYGTGTKGKRRGFSIWKDGKLITPTPLSEYNPSGIDWLLTPDDSVIDTIRINLEQHGHEYTAFPMDRYERPYPPEPFSDGTRESMLTKVDYYHYSYKKVHKPADIDRRRKFGGLVVTQGDLKHIWRQSDKVL